MRATLLAAAALALGLTSTASAKFPIELSLSSDEPTVGEAVRIVVRTDTRQARGCKMQLLALAPGISKNRALAAFISGGIGVIGPSGPSFHRIRPTPRMGFLVRMARTGPKTWRRIIRFPRAGRWRLIVPNWCAPGYVLGRSPADHAVTVRTL